MKPGDLRLYITAACLALSLSTAITASQVLAAGRANPGHSKTAALSSSQSFERYKNQKDYWKLLDDKQVYLRMRAVAGNDIEHYLDWAYATNDMEKSGDDLFTPFTMIGGAGYTAFFDFNYKTGHVCLGWAEDTTWHVYGAKGKLPTPVQKFLDADSDRTDIRYEKPNPKTVVTFSATPAKKNLKIADLTGTYEREPTRHSSGILKVQSLPGGKIKFSVSVTLGGRTGGLCQTVPLVENSITYKDPNSGPDQPQYINIKFRGRDAVIGGADGGFCGAGATLVGTYKKIDDQAPKQFDLP